MSNNFNFHPGYYLKEYMNETQVSKSKLASYLGLTMKQVELLINGTLNIDNHIAEKLSELLGTSPQLWMDLQIKYNENIIK